MDLSGATLRLAAELSVSTATLPARPVGSFPPRARRARRRGCRGSPWSPSRTHTAIGSCRAPAFGLPGVTRRRPLRLLSHVFAVRVHRDDDDRDGHADLGHRVDRSLAVHRARRTGPATPRSLAPEGAAQVSARVPGTALAGLGRSDARRGSDDPGRRSRLAGRVTIAIVTPGRRRDRRSADDRRSRSRRRPPISTDSQLATDRPAHERGDHRSRSGWCSPAADARSPSCRRRGSSAGADYPARRERAD